MSAVKSDGKHIFVTVGNETIVVDIQSNNVLHLKCDMPQPSTANEQDREEWITSPASDLFRSHFVFTYRKCVSLWNITDFRLISNRALIKSASKVRFSPRGNQILLSDKAGDVYIFSVDKYDQPGRLILGHLSMLLDVFSTPDEKYVITCDRDEKIRVSLYPNAYNINCYCLGHEEFVTGISLIPHCDDILVSSSGDCTLRFWYYHKGKELFKHDCLSDIDKSNTEIYDSNAESNGVPILNFASCKLNGNESLISLILGGFKGSLIYKIKGTFNRICCEKVQTLLLDGFPCDIYSNDSNFWYVLNKEHFEVVCFQWNNSDNKLKSVECDGISNAVQLINDQLKDIDKSGYKNIIDILYKQTYDNVQEYLKRKNERIVNENIKKNKTT